VTTTGAAGWAGARARAHLSHLVEQLLAAARHARLVRGNRQQQVGLRRRGGAVLRRQLLLVRHPQPLLLLPPLGGLDQFG